MSMKVGEGAGGRFVFWLSYFLSGLGLLQGMGSNA